MNYIGIDLGGTYIKCGILAKGELVCKSQVPTGAGRPSSQVAQTMADQIKDLLGEAGIGLADIKAVGICSPGQIDSIEGKVVFAANLKWKDAPIAGDLSKLLNLPVYLANDANCAALGEALYGAGKNYKDSLLITLGTGVGGGIIVDGKIFEGGRGAGAEIGHILAVPGGERCTCGRRGCLEAYCSATGLTRHAKEALSKPENKNSRMWEICGGDLEKVSARTVTQALEAGDELAAMLWREYVSILAEGTADLANIFRPDVIMFGGGVSKAGDLLLEPLKEIVENNIFGGNDYARVELAIASLGNDAGIYGAAALAESKGK